MLSFVALEGTVTHCSLRYRVDMHATDLLGLLKTLCQQDYLTSAGRGNGTTYALNPEVKTSASGRPIAWAAA